MKTLDRTSSLFWLLVSIVVLIESIRLGVGTPHNPGMGFLTFGASGILGILSFVLFLRASLRRRETRATPFFASPLWKRALLIIAALIAYSKFMPVLGYLIATFLLMLILFWILERRKIGFVVASSLLATFATYVVFSKWLNCQFPQGLFGF